MLDHSPIHLSDLRAWNRLAIDATLGVTDVVENLHHTIVRLPGVLGSVTNAPARGITGFVYRTVRGVTEAVGATLDGALTLVTPSRIEPRRSTHREALIAALNGVVGDHLEASANPLRIPMCLRYRGQSLQLTRAGLTRDIPLATGKIVVLAHGLCMNDLQWQRNGHDHGTALAADAGYTPIHLHYNSGLHISSNGREFAELLECLVQAWPVAVEQLSLIGFSMGGLLARSACAHAQQEGHEWSGSLRNIVFLGTPHSGSPLERGGNRIDALLGASPYTNALSRLGRIRSAGITDLRHAFLSDADWHGHDRFNLHVQGTHVALPRGVHCHAIAASIARKPGTLRERMFGDGLVPLNSALGLHDDPARTLRLPQSRRWIGHGLHHLDLLDNTEVYERIVTWLSQPGRGVRSRPGRNPTVPIADAPID